MNRRDFSGSALALALGSSLAVADDAAKKDITKLGTQDKPLGGVSVVERFVRGESNSAVVTGRGRKHVPPVDAELSSYAAGLVHFNLAFQNGDHKINTIEAGMVDPIPPYEFAPGPLSTYKAYATLSDRNGDDDFKAQVGWLNFAQGRSYVMSSFANSTERFTNSGQPGFKVPVPRQSFAADHDLVLHGFSVRRPAGTDANVRAFGVSLTTLNRNPAIEVILTDDSGTDTRAGIDAFVSYAWIPKSKVLTRGSVRGQASGKREGRAIPRVYAVMTGFKFEFLNSDHHLLQVGASVRDGGLGFFQDNNTDDPMRWQIDYLTLKG